MMVKTKEKTEEVKRERYMAANGGRKTAFANARLTPVAGDIVVNNKDYKDYFKVPKFQEEVVSPLVLVDMREKMSATVHVRGGGLHAQAQAVRNAIAKALVVFDAELKKRLRRAGFITRDARTVERKKYGLKKARRAPQWQKR